jgi:hypothetical protein
LDVDEFVDAKVLGEADEVLLDEAKVLARSARSLCCRQRVRVVVVLLKTGRNQVPKVVSKMREGKIRRMEQEGCRGEHGVYQNGRLSPSESVEQ